MEDVVAIHQGGWAYPSGYRDRSEYDSGGLQVIVADGKKLLAGMYCSIEGRNRVDLRDASTGEVIDSYGYNKDWWNDPSEHFISFRWRGNSYVLHQNPQYGYCLKRVTAQGYEHTGHETRQNDVVSALAPAVLDGKPAILVCSLDHAVFRDWRNADQVLSSWRAPEGWTRPDLVSIGGWPYAWLGYDVPNHIPLEDRWRVSAEHGSQLWDVIADAPVGAPLLPYGYQWGPWILGERPVVLFKVKWRDVQLWDVARRQPLGPGLGDLDLQNPCVGFLHGRPALAGTIGASLRIWDIGTGRLLGTVALPEKPIATAVGAKDTAWAITRTGYVESLTISATQIHPAATRHTLR
ncbi:hypothetical protein ABT272_42320 [Streptomyces sp900105245]|uniref:WD40 repeat domain-containing protein n=1 Tax=Streptomyces sp. 900105245 TaxID=3154379 RepID=A0ABV1UL51_9ACTN